MNLLFLHQNFPGQYRHLASHFARASGHKVCFVTQANDNRIERVRRVVYEPDKRRLGGCHALTVPIDTAVRTGAAVADACRKLNEEGFRPDLAIGHAGWGETLFLKDVFPNLPVLANFEFYYHVDGADVGFDPEYQSVFTDAIQLRVKNAVNHLAFAAADWGHTATEWQRSLFSKEMQTRITTLHEGVDTDVVRPQATASVKLVRDDLELTAEH